MAPKRPSPLDDPPAGSSSEEEETTSGEEEDVSKEESSSDEEEEKEKVDSKLKKSAPLPSASASASGTDKKATHKKQDRPKILLAQASSSDSGSGSDSESDAEAEKNVKPIASKPMEEIPKRPKLREKANMEVRSSVKRPSQSIETKRAKKGSEALLDDEAVAERDSKKTKTGDVSRKLFQRLWSEEDEIIILKGICDYTAKKGLEPPPDMNDFHNFIKKYLHTDGSRSQLRDKIRRLKKKYKNNLKRGRKGNDPTFTKFHEQKVFELAKRIWGHEVESSFSEQPTFNGTPRKSQRASSSKSVKEELLGMPENVKQNDKMDADGNRAQSECLNELLDFIKNQGVGGLAESIVKQGLELIDGSMKTELDNRWKKVLLAELELFVCRKELVIDQARILSEASKSSNK